MATNGERPNNQPAEKITLSGKALTAWLATTALLSAGLGFVGGKIVSVEQSREADATVTAPRLAGHAKEHRLRPSQIPVAETVLALARQCVGRAAAAGSVRQVTRPHGLVITISKAPNGNTCRVRRQDGQVIGVWANEKTEDGMQFNLKFDGSETTVHGDVTETAWNFYNGIPNSKYDIGYEGTVDDKAHRQSFATTCPPHLNPNDPYDWACGGVTVLGNPDRPDTIGAVQSGYNGFIDGFEQALADTAIPAW